jgi:hypothetical protein
MKIIPIFKIYTFCITLSLLTNQSLTIKIKEPIELPYSEKCNQDLVRSFGLIGKTLPSAAPLEMCPSVKDSCCVKKDQMMIYNNWVSMKENEYVKRLFDIMQEKYMHFLNLLNKVEGLIKKVLSRLERRKISNCKVLGKRILHYEITALMPQIKKNIKKMRDFLEESYKGVYCSVCDHQNHNYIDDQKRIINYSDSFCREMLEAGLPFLIFFHSDIVKFVNLITKFMVSCDYKGDYETEALLPKRMIFFEDEEDRHKLGDCRKFRNSKEWMAYCAPVCEHFNIAMVHPFFQPNLELISKYNKWLEKMIDFKKIEHTQHPLFEESNKKKKGGNDLSISKDKPLKEINLFNTGNSKSDSVESHHNHHEYRILQTNSKIKTKKIKRKKNNRLLQAKSKKQTKEEEILNREKIFISKINSKFPLETYKTSFSGQGICLYETGMASLINDSVYNEVKTIYHLSKMKKSPNGIIRIVKNIVGIGGVSKDEKKEIEKLNSYSHIIKFENEHILISYALVFIMLLFNIF